MPRYQFMPEAIHADWPAYPAGHGPEYALETLCCFPSGTHFRALDEIDECCLLVSVEHQDRRRLADPFSDQHHHVALWHDDLRQLRDEGWLEGFRPRPTGNELREYWMKQAGTLPGNALSASIKYAQSFGWESVAMEGADEDQLAGSFSADGLVVTATGWRSLWSLADVSDMGERLITRVAPLLTIGYLDSAVREAAIMLEESLRVRTGTRRWGQRLVDLYVDQIVAKAGCNGAFQRHMRSELRTLFMFVRNEFAHNIVRLDRGRCHAMLYRISAIYDMLNEADQGAYSFQDIILATETRSQSLEDDDQ